MNWEAPCNILREAERLVSLHSPYAESDKWALTKEHHGLWAEPAILAMQALPAGSKVLEVGPGYGALAVAATLLRHRVTAVELFLEALEWPGIEWVRGDIQDPDLLPDDRFDFGLMTEVLEHLNYNPKAAFRNVYMALRPGTQFLGSTPTPGVWPEELPTGPLPEWQPGKPVIDCHVRLYSQEEVARLLREAGFDVLEQAFLGGRHLRHLWRARKHEWDPERLCTSAWDAKAEVVPA